MIPELRSRPVPKWLAKASALPAWKSQRVPIRGLLSGSLYYPACGPDAHADGDPVREFAGYVHSFVYVDYNARRGALVSCLDHPRQGFKGYSVLNWRYVREHDLVPARWWVPAVAAPARGGGRPRPPVGPPGGPVEWLPKSAVSAEFLSRGPVPPNEEDGNWGGLEWDLGAPFAVWSVHQRNAGLGNDHGPERFSLLYVCGDGVAAFQALYHGHRCRPRVVAIIQPGTGFGGNWTDFEDPARIFCRSVLGNPSGAPEYLLCEGWGKGRCEEFGKEYLSCCWPLYDELVRYWTVGKPRPEVKLALWKRPWAVPAP